MGADGINMGTRFMVTKEAPIHEKVKQKWWKQLSLIPLWFTDIEHTARVFKNSVAQQVIDIESRPGKTQFEDLQSLVQGAKGRELFDTGDLDKGIWSAGMIVGLIDDIFCHELISRIVAEAEEIIKRRLIEAVS